MSNRNKAERQIASADSIQSLTSCPRDMNTGDGRGLYGWPTASLVQLVTACYVWLVYLFSSICWVLVHIIFNTNPIRVLFAIARGRERIRDAQRRSTQTQQRVRELYQQLRIATNPEVRHRLEQALREAEARYFMLEAEVEHFESLQEYLQFLRDQARR